MQEALQERNPKIQLNAVFQVLVSALGLFFALMTAAFLLVIGIVGMVEGSTPDQELMPILAMTFASAFFFILLIPPLIYSFLRMLKKEPLAWKIKNPFRLALIGMGVWVVVMALGILFNNLDFGMYFLPVLQLFAIALPILFFVELGRRGLQQNESDRDWGILSFGLVITQPVVMVVEIILVLVGMLFAFFWIFSQPELMNELGNLSQRLMNSQFNPQIMQSILEPFMQRPGVIYIILVFGAGFVPLLEEMLKPLVLWLFIGKRFSPKQGFVMGLLAGGTFALIESLGMAASASGTTWHWLVLGRMGTGILHITTTALMGWGLGMAWQKRQYLQLGLIYLSAVALHSVWNIFGLLSGIAPFVGSTGFISWLASISTPALIVLMVVLIGILIYWNIRLRNQQDLNMVSEKTVSTPK